MTDQQTSTNEPKYHPACLLLPEMIDQEYRELVEDIRAYGQREAILVDVDDLILDGRHRWRACQELEIVPKIERFTGSEAAKVALVISRNVHRRHLTTQQRAAIAAELATMKSGARTDLASIDAWSQLSDAQAAKLMKVSEPSVERAKRRLRTDPEAHAKAKAGTLGRRKPVRRARPIDGDLEAAPKPARRVDLLETLRMLELALPESFDVTAWAVAMPQFQRRDVVRLLRVLWHRLDQLVGKLGGTRDEREQMDIEDAIADQPVELDIPAARNGYAERGAAIRAARIAKGLTAKKLAEAANVLPNVVSMVELARLTKIGWTRRRSTSIRQARGRTRSRCRTRVTVTRIPSARR